MSARLHCPDHLVEHLRRHLVDASAGALRHALKNKLAAIHNSVYLVKKRLLPSSPPAELERTTQLFEMMVSEIKLADGLLEESRQFPPTDPQPVDLGLSARALVAALALPAGLAIEGPAPPPEGPPLSAAVPGLDLELLLFLLIEEVLAGVDGPGRVVLQGERRAAQVALAIRCAGSARALELPGEERFFGPGSWGLKLAQRLAAQWGGELSLAAGAATLVFPEAKGVAA